AAVVLHSGAAGVGTIATAAYLPNVVLPLVAGAWLEDRHRRAVMVAMDIARAGMLLVIPVAAWTGSLSIGLLAAVALGVGSATVVFEIASFAYIPTLVNEVELPAANRASQGSATAAQVAGPGVAGVLVGAFG